MKNSLGDRIFFAINYIFLSLVFVMVAYPLLYMLACSFSSPQAVTAGKVVLWPVDFTLMGYETIFRDASIWTGYGNTIIYTAVGTFLSTVLTLLAAYPLSRKDFVLANPCMMLFTFTMFFGGGLIPTYILISNLGLINTRWVMIIPGALSVYNIILTRTFIRSNIPQELIEATQIDGCSDFRFLCSFVIPLSKAIIAVVALFYAVGVWNSYFNALIYLNDKDLYPLQMILRTILIQNKFDSASMTQTLINVEDLAAKQKLYELLKYSLIVVASVPILCVYPFVQKYFVQGVMIGSIKG